MTGWMFLVCGVYAVFVVVGLLAFLILLRGAAILEDKQDYIDEDDQ